MAVKEVDIVILYEKAVRELDVACAIKYLSKEKYDREVEIVQWPYGYLDACRRFTPRVVVLPFHYQVKAQMYLYGWQNSTFFNITWEQLFYPGNEKAKTPRGQVALKHLIHHAWGDDYAGLLQRQGVPRERIFLNGQPAYALYREPYCSYYKQVQELASLYQLDPKKKWVFFPENYNWAFYSEGMLNQMIADGQPREQVYQMRDFASRSFEAVIHWCYALALQSDVELIIRPRPATLLEDFKARLLASIPSLPENIHIIQKESVREWILASNLVISSYSTSLIEAAVAGREFFMLEPFALLPSLRQVWHQLVPRLTDEEMFIEACNRVGGHEIDRRLGIWAQTTFLGKGDPIMNLVDELANLCLHKVPLPPKLTWQAITPSEYEFLPRWMIYLYHRIQFEILKWMPSKIRIWYRTLKGVRPVWDEDLEYEADFVPQQEIQMRIHRWAKTLGTIEKTDDPGCDAH